MVTKLSSNLLQPESFGGVSAYPLSIHLWRHLCLPHFRPIISTPTGSPTRLQHIYFLAHHPIALSDFQRFPNTSSIYNQFLTTANPRHDFCNIRFSWYRNFSGG